MDLSAIRPATKADAAYRKLRRRIIDASLVPGSRLDQELLATTLGVSTTPLREALRRLEAERLVERAAHRQVVIAPLSRREFRELYEIRLELDSLSVALAARTGRRSDLLDAERHLAAPNLPREGLQFNRAFHRALYAACGNAVLIEVLDSLWDRSARYRFFLIRDPEEPTVAAREHRRLLALTAAGDAEGASSLMRRHLQRSAAQIEPLMRDRWDGDDPSPDGAAP
ncbi:MAG: GntR family transcriptional regulator [Acidimicrobiales bacterium]